MAKVFVGINHTAGSFASRDDGRLVDRTISGEIQSRVLFDEMQYEVVIIWSGVTLAEKVSIEADYDANTDVEFEVDLLDSEGNATTYERLHWIEIPNLRPAAKVGGRWVGQCSMAGYKQ